MRDKSLFIDILNDLIDNDITVAFVCNDMTSWYLKTNFPDYLSKDEQIEGSIYQAKEFYLLNFPVYTMSIGKGTGNLENSLIMIEPSKIYTNESKKGVEVKVHVPTDEEIQKKLLVKEFHSYKEFELNKNESKELLKSSVFIDISLHRFTKIKSLKNFKRISFDYDLSRY